MTAEHLSISPHAACPTGLQPAVDVSSPKTSQTQTTQGFTVNAAPDMSRRGRREKVSLSAVIESVVECDSPTVGLFTSSQEHPGPS